MVAHKQLKIDRKLYKKYVKYLLQLQHEVYLL